jgi:hypothetical protein
MGANDEVLINTVKKFTAQATNIDSGTSTIKRHMTVINSVV